MRIGGNTDAVIQMSAGRKDNGIGQKLPEWKDVFFVCGWLDMQEGDSGFTRFNTKIQESTHIFIMDYQPLVHEGTKITPENSRMVIDSKVYEVKLYDNPMNMDTQLEIYLKYMGGQNECND